MNRSAHEAFNLLATNDVQIMLCDQHLLDMTGSAFYDRVKYLHPHTFRIILSTYAELEPIMEAINRGSVHRYYTKP